MLNTIKTNSTGIRLELPRSPQEGDTKEVLLRNEAHCLKMLLQGSAIGLKAAWETQDQLREHFHKPPLNPQERALAMLSKKTLLYALPAERRTAMLTFLADTLGEQKLNNICLRQRSSINRTVIERPLAHAIVHGDVNDVRTLIEKGADPALAVRSELDIYGNAHQASDALTLAIKHEAHDVVRYLVEIISPTQRTLALLLQQPSAYKEAFLILAQRAQNPLPQQWVQDAVQEQNVAKLSLLERAGMDLSSVRCRKQILGLLYFGTERVLDKILRDIKHGRGKNAQVTAAMLRVFAREKQTQTEINVYLARCLETSQKNAFVAAVARDYLRPTPKLR